MSKVYCINCGHENKDTNKKCTNCHTVLKQEEHLWKEYLYNHVKDDLKGKVTDKWISLIKNYVFSHLYGVVITSLVIITGGTFVYNTVSNNYIEEVSENPLISIRGEEIEVNEKIEELYKFNQLNYDSAVPMSLYLGKKVTYESFTDNERLQLAYMSLDYKDKFNERIYINDCEEVKDYEGRYALCNSELNDFVVGEIAFDHYIMKKEVLENSYHKLFGSDKKLPKDTFKVHYSLECEYSDKASSYLCYSLPAGWLGIPVENTEIYKVYKKENEIVIYDYFVHLDPTYNDSVYTGYDRETQISDSTSDYDITKGSLFRHVYKKDKDGNYYWFSSEKVNGVNEE